jgi:hypothetical protein
MRKQFPAIALLTFVALSASAANAQAQTCGQIREQIETQTGVLPAVNVPLLQNMSARQDCRFSAAEVYRAAYGDKPLPKPAPSALPQNDREDD